MTHVLETEKLVTAAENTNTEVLFPEAKRRERYRRLIMLAVIVAVGGVVLGLVATSGGDGPPVIRTASPGYLRTFLDRAKHALDSSFTATYTLSNLPSEHFPGVERVHVAQLSSTQFMYGESEPPGDPISRMAFFSNPPQNTTSRSKSYSCTVPQHGSRWTCALHESGWYLGNGYLPSSTVRGLSLLMAMHARPSLAPQDADQPKQIPALETTRIADGHKLSCVEFGSSRNPLATVCLTATGLVGYYASRLMFVGEPIRMVVLDTYKPGTAIRQFVLPSAVPS